MNYINKEKGYYVNERAEMLDFFPKEAKTVLDVGCGQGTFAQQIKPDLCIKRRSMSRIKALVRVNPEIEKHH
jgi:SAM-dependent methyltransferase